MSRYGEVFIAGEDIRAGDRVKVDARTGQVVRVTGASPAVGGMCSCDGPPHPYSPGWCNPRSATAGAERYNSVHTSISNRFRVTMDLTKVTCTECLDAIEAAQQSEAPDPPVDASDAAKITHQRTKRARSRVIALLGTEVGASSEPVRVYLPEALIRDARECDPDLDELWQRIEAAPRARRGAGWGSWVELDRTEAEQIRDEATYRAEYWLSDKYGVEEITSRERSAGKAASRVHNALTQILNADTTETHGDES